MPRTLAAVLAGSGVAVAGSVMQMSMHNRFVSPTTAGTSQFALVGLLAVAFTVGGVLFPVMMNLLQSLTTSARGTVSALASVLMYAGSTLAGVIGGPLLAALPSFWGVSLLALGTTLVALGLWAASDCLRSEPAGE